MRGTSKALAESILYGHTGSRNGQSQIAAELPPLTLTYHGPLKENGAEADKGPEYHWRLKLNDQEIAGQHCERYWDAEIMARKYAREHGYDKVMAFTPAGNPHPITVGSK